MKKRTSLAVFYVCMLFLMLPTAAFATSGGAQGTPLEINLENGSVIIGQDTYTQGTEEAKPIPEGGLVLTGQSDTNTITVDPGEDAIVAFTLKNMNLSTVAGASLIDIQSGSASIALEGINTLTGGIGDDDHALIHVGEGEAITLSGEGSLVLNNGSESDAAHGASIGGNPAETGGAITITDGDITITQYGPAAGIGGGGPNNSTGSTGDSGTIHIAGGTLNVTVTAVDNYGGGCGIGPGMNYYTAPSNNRDGILNSVDISGGSVTVKTVSSGSSYYAGAAIGTGRIGGNSEEECIVSISGENTVVNATSDCSAAIGGSAIPVTVSSIPNTICSISIEGATVSAITKSSSVYQGVTAAAIGAGLTANTDVWINYDINIFGSAAVKAEAGPYGAGIGTSYSFVHGKMNICIQDEAEVFARGGDCGAGIGTSFNQRVYNNGDTDIIITGNADVTAVGGYYAAGIGAGYVNRSGDITISGSARIKAVGGYGASAIGGGYGQYVAGTTKITDGTTIEAYADGTKFAIDTDVYNIGSIDVADTVLNGRFAEDELSADQENHIDLIKGNEVDYSLTMPENYRSFAVTASDGVDTICVQEQGSDRLACYRDDENGGTDSDRWFTYPLYEEDPYVMVTKDQLRWVEPVTITPADITVYVGGKGYESVVENEDGETVEGSGLPRPGYFMDLTQEAQECLPDMDSAANLADYLSFYYYDSANEEVLRCWDLEDQGVYSMNETGETTRYVYSLSDNKEGENIGAPVRLLFTNPNVDGAPSIISDEITMGDDFLYANYNMTIYSGGLDQQMVVARFKAKDNTYLNFPVKIGTGELTVKRVMNTDDGNPVTDIVTSPEEIAADTTEDQIVAVDGGTVTYYVNDSGVEIPRHRVQLLVDKISNDEEFNISIGNDAIEKAKANFSSSSLTYDTAYLDLVDVDNGNVVATMNDDATLNIYWPAPSDAAENSSYYIVHYYNMKRDNNGDIIGDDWNTNLYKGERVAVNGKDYITFQVSSLSPFVLVYENEDTSGGGGSTGGGTTPNPPVLNTEDHFSYVVGYPEDYRTGEPSDNEELWPVKPQGNITRAEVASIFYRLLKDDVRDANTTDVSEFSDVSASDWYGTTVATLSAMDIVRGYEDGTFRPNAPITRAEFAAIATRFFEETGAEYEPGTFDDVTGNEWFANAIADAVELGLIGGYPDGTVRPNNNITRAEACAIVNRTLGRIPHVDHLLPADDMKTWPDNNPSDWFYADMQEATNGHEYEWTTEQGQKVEEWTAIIDKDWNSRSK